MARAAGKPLQIAVDGVTGTTEAMQTCGAIERRSSCVVVQWRLTALIGNLLADVDHLGAHLEHDPPDVAPVARSPRGAHRVGRLDNAVRVSQAMPSISASTSARRTSRATINRSCSISVLTLACPASASLRGDCRRSRRGSRHLAAGSRLRLRACRCKFGCNRGAAPVPSR